MAVLLYSLEFSASATVFRMLEQFYGSVRVLDNFGVAFALRASSAVAGDTLAYVIIIVPYMYYFLFLKNRSRNHVTA